MRHNKDQHPSQASSDAAKEHLSSFINDPDVKASDAEKEKRIPKPKYMDNKKVFQELDFINSEGGPQQLANLIAEGCFCTLLHRLKEDGNQSDYEYVEDCYANWKWLTRDAKKQPQ